MADNKNDSDESLMVRIQNADHRAFAQLVGRHTDRFFRTAYRISGDAFEAEDIVQESFLKLWQKPEIWQDGKGAKFTTWFYRIVSNQAVDHVRKKKPQTGLEPLEHVVNHAGTQEQTIQRTEEQAMLEDAIGKLPKRQKRALNLCIYEELSNKEAAEIMGVGVKALESLLSRAKGKLKDNLVRSGAIKIGKRT